MESVYSSYNANATSQINIGEYFTKYKQLNDLTINNIEMNLNDRQMKELSEKCSINNLMTNEYFIPPINRVALKKLTPKIPSNIKLETLSRLKEKYLNEPKVYKPALKYRNETTINYSESLNETNDLKAIPGEDILVSIRIYHPFSCQNFEPTKKRLAIILNNVIVILGKQTLAQLRDKIDCISDLSCTIESSDNPTEFLHDNNKDTYKSSFFYIENTFYNDTRHKDCKDNSLPILNWAKTRNLGPFNTKNMEDIRIDSLCVRFGYPWVFQHQGYCEHLITFSDARLIDWTDHLEINNYPRVSRAKPVKHPYCLMCIERPVHWMVTANERLPHDPCHFCHQCFIRYNYIDGKKIGTFKAYRYPHNADIRKWLIIKKKTLQLN